MRWIKFPDGSLYTFAVDIQNFAEKHGYTVPCEKDGTRHPGTDCNAKIRSVFKDTGMRRTFKLSEQSVVKVDINESYYNEQFIRWAVDSGLVGPTYLSKGQLQLYSLEAVNALLSVMLRETVVYVMDDMDYQWYCSIPVIKTRHNVEKKKNKPKVSLFNK